MKVAIAIDSFKGSIGSLAAGAAARAGLLRAIPGAECAVYPLADGGEGTMEALTECAGGEFREVRVCGPDGVAVRARYGLRPDGVAVMEMAQAAGLTLVAPDRRDPLAATTFGVGEMILDAVAAGAKRIVMGIGGSATNDGGAGMLEALGFRLFDSEGERLPRGGAALADLSRIEPPRELPRIGFKIACDVDNPLCGERGASAVYGPQKGASPDAVRRLDDALRRFAAVAGVDGNFPGAGAAGGLGFAFKTFLDAELVPGVELVLDETHIAGFLRDADFAITGEGRLDGQTVMGKAPIGVARLAKKLGVRTIAVCGCLGDGVEAVNGAGIDAYFPVLGRLSPGEDAMRTETAAANIARTVEQVFRLLKG